MNKITISSFDRDRLVKLLEKKKPHDGYSESLLEELNRANIVEPKDVPPDVVTMNSRISFMDDHGDEWAYWLVFPEDADLTQNRISILSPVGCALLGYQTGDKILLPTPRGRHMMTVKQVVYQPEREGRFDL